MEVGKIRTNASNVFLFYFIVDPVSPDSPNASRLQHYFVTSTLDSHIDAFLFLVRSLVSPPLDSVLRQWHNAYSKMFVTVPYDSFVSSIHNLNPGYFHLETTEGAARAYADKIIGSSPASVRVNVSAGSSKSPSRRQIGGFDGPPTSPGETSADVFRLRSDLAEVSGQLRAEKNKQSVSLLSNADFAAVQYKLDTALRDADMERQRAAEAEVVLREQLSALEERLERLVMQHDAALTDALNQHRSAQASAEQNFNQRQTAMQNQYEQALQERDFQIQQAHARGDELEATIQRQRDELGSVRSDNTRLVELVRTGEHDREALQAALLQQRDTVQDLSQQADEYRISVQRLDESSRRLENELISTRADLLRWRQEAERYARFTSGLQTDLRGLEDSSAAAAELLRHKLLNEPRWPSAQ